MTGRTSRRRRWPSAARKTAAWIGEGVPGSNEVLADTIPNGNGKLHLIPGLGHVPHMEDAAKTLPPLVAFLKEGAR